MTTVAHAPNHTSIGRMIGVLALMLAIIGVFSYGAFVVAAPLGWLAQPQSRVAVFLGGAMIGELAAFGALAGLLRRRGQSLRTLGLGKRTNWRGLVLALLVAGVYCAITALNPAVGSHLTQFIPLKLLAVVAALVAGLVEETIFRGYVMTTLAASRRGPVAQVVVSGVCFAIAHFYAAGDLRHALRSGRRAGGGLSAGWAQPNASHHRACAGRSRHRAVAAARLLHGCDVASGFYALAQRDRRGLRGDARWIENGAAVFAGHALRSRMLRLDGMQRQRTVEAQ
jgi:membrane protease YdiL (CAAX protease family)